MGRARVPLVWGQGLDRNTGNLAVDAASFLDLRNLLVRESKLLARGGLVTPSDAAPFAGATDVVGGFPFRTVRGSIIVTYNRTTRVLTVWQVDGFGAEAINLGDWATLPAGAPLPIVTGAETYGKLFLAHAEPLFNYRAKTIYVDPTLTPGTQLVDLTSDLNGDSAAEVLYFRGVYAYLDYLVGWGFGTGSDQNRPEIVHVSLPGNPLVFDKQQYFLAGVREEAVTGVLENGGQFRVQKKGEAFKIRGTGAANFGIDPLEKVYGQISERLGLTVGAEGVFWSEQGPRIAAGGASQDIALPLELGGPEPLDLAAAGPDAYGWSVYVPDERVIIFGFPVLDPVAPITRCYVVSRRNPAVISWAYFELQQAIYCAWLVIEGAATVGTAPTGYASALAAADTAASGTGRTVHVSWTNNALIGGESAQLFIKPTGGAWALAATVDATALAANLLGLDALTDYAIAIRMVKGGLATDGYGSIDPDDWTASTAPGSKTVVATTCQKPTALAGVWSRVGSSTHQVAFSFTLPELGVGVELQQSDDGVGGWATIETEAAPFDARVFNVAMSDALLTLTKYFRLRAIKGAYNSPHSDVLALYIGPSVSPRFSLIVQTGTTAVFETWLRAIGAAGTILNVQTSPNGATGWVDQFLSSAYTRKQAVPSPIALASVTFVRLRFGVTSHTIDDFGPWVSGGSIKLTNAAVPSNPTTVAAAWGGVDNSIHATYDDPGGALGTFIEYTDMDGLGLSATLVDPATATDIFDVRDTGATYSPFDHAAAVPTESIDVFTVDNSSGKFKISGAVTVAADMTFAAPTALVPTTVSLGKIDLQYAEGIGAGYLSLGFWWNDPATTFGNNLNVSNPTTAIGHVAHITGPILGLMSLPANGSAIIVAVVHYGPGVSGRYGKRVVANWTVGT